MLCALAVDHVAPHRHSVAALAGIGHNYIRHECLCRSYAGHNYIGHGYVGHSHVGQNFVDCVATLTGHSYVAITI